MHLEFLAKSADLVATSIGIALFVFMLLAAALSLIALSPVAYEDYQIYLANNRQEPTPIAEVAGIDSINTSPSKPIEVLTGDSQYQISTLGSRYTLNISLKSKDINSGELFRLVNIHNQIKVYEIAIEDSLGNEVAFLAESLSQSSELILDPSGSEVINLDLGQIEDSSKEMELIVTVNVRGLEALP